MTTAAPSPRTADSGSVRSAGKGRIPGILLGGAVAGLAAACGPLLPGASPLILAMVAGVVLANTVGPPAAAGPGLTFCSQTLLRAGIVLLGLQIVLGDILALGAGASAVLVAVVVCGLLGTLLIGRALRLPPSLTLLVACGFSICGAAAVGAAAGVADPRRERDQDVVTAVALVVLCGTLMIPLLPLAAASLGLDAADAGLWAGAAVHEVAHVVAVGAVLGGDAPETAVVAKLGRVLMLAPAVAVLGLHLRRRRAVSAGGRRPPIVPPFVLGFLAMVALRSTVPPPEVVLDVAAAARTLLLAAAMFALGCGVRLHALVAVGPRPLILAGLSTLLVAAVALGGVLLVG
ncbi:putative sulfate exporter family transporter [Nesterenkonia halophila]|uniref:YeiH family protein n=1 Tax=Nesterenkonia halophila TaxID=302044 RepID=UPI001FE58033|nr:putative sulfate exporter family transporter [Nesterenkonia halophila]